MPSFVGYWYENGAIGQFNVTSSQQLYSTAGTYSFTVPARVRVIQACAIGAGSKGLPPDDASSDKGCGGGGGAIAYVNNISVVPGETLTVVVGSSYTTDANAVHSIIRRGSTVLLKAEGAVLNIGGNAANCVGDVAYNGGNGGAGGNGSGNNLGYPQYKGGGGGGGAGGYSGNGGNGGSAETGFFANNSTAGENGAGGAGGGGGGAGMYYFSGDGGIYYGINSGGGAGGTGILVSGSNGNGGSRGPTGGGGNAGNGSGGSSGNNGATTGGIYGGGGGGPYFFAHTVNGLGLGPVNAGAAGAVRIIWGNNRNYPSSSASV